jgi:enterochelin esterase family protein
MGGAQTLAIGLNHLDKFRWIGAFSAAINANATQAYAAALADPGRTNQLLKAFHLYCGDTDFLFEANRAFHAQLEQAGIAHEFHISPEGHVWRNWRDYLADFAPRLFR